MEATLQSLEKKINEVKKEMLEGKTLHFDNVDQFERYLDTLMSV